MNLSEKMESVFERLTPVIDKIANNRFLQGMSGGMMATLPVTIVGSFALLLNVVPLGPVSDIIQSSGLGTALNATYNYSMGILSVYIAFLVAKGICQQYLEGDDGITPAIIALMCFLIVTPLTAAEDGASAISFTWLGASGAFTALITAAVAAYTYIFCTQKNLTIKMPKGVPPMVSAVFAGLIPFVVCAVFFTIVSYGFAQTEMGSFHQLIYSLLQAPMTQLGGSIWAMLLISVLAQFLWFFGIHGQNVLSPFYTPVWMAMDAANLAAISAGQPAPNIVGNAFYSLFAFGGYQIALCLLLLRACSQQYRSFGKLGIGPAIFGIGEPLNFGMPLILNFKFIVPFLTNSVICLAVAYLAIASGLVPHMYGVSVIFGLTFGVGAFMQGGWRILVLAIVVNIVIPYFLWLPWVRRADSEAYAQEQEMSLAELAQEDALEARAAAKDPALD